VEWFKVQVLSSSPSTAKKKERKKEKPCWQNFSNTRDSLVKGPETPKRSFEDNPRNLPKTQQNKITHILFSLTSN
jgi:hypothetical protein